MKTNGVKMKEITCCDCGVKIFVEDQHYDNLVNTKKTFYCINGDAQHFTSKTDAEKERERADELQKRLIEKEKEYAILSKFRCPQCKKTFY